MEEKRTKLSFSISSKRSPPKHTARLAAAGPQHGSATQFITTFDPAEALTLPAPPAAVIAPLPNSRRPSAVLTDGAPAFETDASDSDSPASAGYGLTVRDTEESKRRNLAARDDAAAAAAARRFRQDVAVLPDDTQESADEYGEVPVKGFGAALLAGYGWKDGDSLGRDKSKGDPKIVERGRSSGTQGLGAGPSDKKDSTVRPVERRSIRDLRVACSATD